jgi:hypothetical protein
VSDQVGVTLHGLANDIVDTIRSDAVWSPLADGVEVAQAAAAGKLVIGGLRGDEQTHPDAHGHVVVVVAVAPGQQLAHVNWAWRAEDRDNVSYAAHDIT